MSKARDISNLFSGSTSASTDAEVTAAIAAHSSANDPHGDRAAATIDPTNDQTVIAMRVFG